MNPLTFFFSYQRTIALFTVARNYTCNSWLLLMRSLVYTSNLGFILAEIKSSLTGPKSFFLFMVVDNRLIV